MSQTERENFDGLCAALLGEIPQDADWNGILALANRTLVTPALSASLEEHEDIPEEVGDFLRHIAERTAMRNETMRRQLRETVHALALVGLEPILIKGAVFLADRSFPIDQRLFADLDLLLPHSQEEAAIAALGKVGFSPYETSVGAKDGMNLKRTSDVGGLDLHFRLRSLPGAPDYAEMMPFVTPTTVGENKIRNLVPTAQAVVLIVHDQIQERDYWRGLIDLRHLLDLDRIVRVHGPLDSGVLHRLFPTSASRRVLDTQLLTAKRLFGTPLPRNWRTGRRAKLQAQRRDWQMAHSAATHFLTAASLLSDLPALASPLAALPNWRHRLRYLRRMFSERKDTKV